MSQSLQRGLFTCAIGLLCLALTGCPDDSSKPSGGTSSTPKSTALEGAYHSPSMASMVLDFKGNKCRVNVMGETKELDFKVEGDKVTILDPKDGDLVLTMNSDGSMTSPGGTFSKK